MRRKANADGNANATDLLPNPTEPLLHYESYDETSAVDRSSGSASEFSRHSQGNINTSPRSTGDLSDPFESNYSPTNSVSQTSAQTNGSEMFYRDLYGNSVTSYSNSYSHDTRQV